jgi:hypothetical protein
MGDQRTGEVRGETPNYQGFSGPEKMGAQEELYGQGRTPPRGFVHVLWLLVVLSAFLFGAALVNVAIGMKICETSARQSAAIEKLTLSVREVQQTVFHLSRVIQETFQAEEEYESNAPSEDGRI